MYCRVPIEGSPINEISNYMNSPYFLKEIFNRTLNYPNSLFLSFFFSSNLACEIESPINVSLGAIITKKEMEENE